MTELQVLSDELGGSSLAQLGMAGHAGADGVRWFQPRPSSGAEWLARMEEVRATVPAGWAASLAPAMGSGARLLERVSSGRGVVVTTGQQPGLFGGPLYTLHKALSCIELAAALERETGIAALPVFWAATDDADFAEGASVWVRMGGAATEGARRLTLTQLATEGTPMSEVPLEGVAAVVQQFAEIAGAALDTSPLELVTHAYRDGQTIGDAYVSLLRALLEPLGMPVLDASHAAVRTAAAATLRRALERADRVAVALRDRGAALRAAGHEPQVAEIDSLSLVFRRDMDAGGRKTRVPVTNALQLANSVEEERCSPNVLLRPVVERAILPTVAYVAGPGELAYFAQVSAVAAALDAPQPLGVPRWSGTLLEPDVQRTLARFGLSRADLVAGHAAERSLARRAVPADVLDGLSRLRQRVIDETTAFKALVERHSGVLDPRVVDGTTRAMQFRVDRLERRVLAAAKRREDGMMREIAQARGALFPGGHRQERALAFVQLLAVHGPDLVGRMRSAAARHADALVRGLPLFVQA